VSRQGLGQQRGKGKRKNHWPWGRGKGCTQGQGGVVKIVEEGKVGGRVIGLHCVGRGVLGVL
jgi:hypothetical protein